MPPILEDLSIAIGLLALMIAAIEIGFRTGKAGAASRKGASGEADPRSLSQIGAVQGALLGVLGLLLALSFAGSATRFLEKQDLIVEEANAIGTSYLRADLLDEPFRSELRDNLRRYTQHRIEVSNRMRVFRGELSEQEAATIDQLHASIWKSAVSGVKARPDSMLGVLPPVNDVIDLHSTRVAAARKHLPMIIIGLLVVCSAMAMAVIGYGSGISGRRRAFLTIPLAMILATSLWVTIDLDHPRAGLLRLNDAPLKSLRFD